MLYPFCRIIVVSSLLGLKTCLVIGSQPNNGTKNIISVVEWGLNLKKQVDHAHDVLVSIVSADTFCQECHYFNSHGSQLGFFSTPVAGIATYTCGIQVSSGFISPLYMVKYMMPSATWSYQQVREGKQEQQQQKVPIMLNNLWNPTDKQLQNR